VPAGSPNIFEVWQIDGPSQVLRSLPGPGPISALSYSPDGHWLVTSHLVRRGPSGKTGADQFNFVAVVWDGATGTRLRTLDGGDVKEFRETPRLENGASLAVSSGGGSLRCRVPLKDGIDRHASECGLCLSPDGRRLAAADMWGTIQLWETDTGAHVFELRGLAGSFGTIGIRALVAFDDTGWRLASLNNNDTTNVYDATPLGTGGQ